MAAVLRLLWKRLSLSILGGYRSELTSPLAFPTTTASAIHFVTEVPLWCIRLQVAVRKTTDPALQRLGHTGNVWEHHQWCAGRSTPTRSVDSTAVYRLKFVDLVVWRKRLAGQPQFG